jgi:hypothetical protein
MRLVLPQRAVAGGRACFASSSSHARELAMVTAPPAHGVHVHQSPQSVMSWLCAAITSPHGEREPQMSAFRVVEKT